MEELKKPRIQFGVGVAPDKPGVIHDGLLPAPSAAVLAGMQAGNINVTLDLMRLMDASQIPDRQQELLAEFEKRKKARAIIVPTDDTQVKARLREFKEPICLFGEGPADRRERLRLHLADLAERGVRIEKQEVEGESSQPLDEDTVWYHEGLPELLAARYWIAEYSIPRAQERLVRAREEVLKPGAEKAAKKQELHKKLRQITNICSQVGDDRPISYCQFSPDSKMLATASWSGLCKLWSVPDCEPIRVLRGHNDKAGSIAFHPQATLSLSPSVLNMASCAADGSVCLWNLESDTPIANLEGHLQRVSRINYHPSGKFLATACFDCSWRLWDLETLTEVLHQEGHSRSVFNVAFHPDGSLAGSCGFDGAGRVWDLRSGKCIMLLDGHLKNVLALDFSPNGYHIATGSADNTVNIWDLRRRKCIYTIPAHNNLVSHIKFQGSTGDFILTSSYDNTAKVWAHPGWTPLKTLAGHESKVMCIDLSPNQEYIATSSYDRTFKLWQREVAPP